MSNRETVNSVKFALKLLRCGTAKKEDIRDAVNILTKKVPQLIDTIARLNRIMPHTGETCKHWTKYVHCDKAFNSCAPCKNKDNCNNSQWELRD